VDQALFAVVIEAYLPGVPTRKIDDLVKALGADTGISKSEVSRICAYPDAEVGAFRDRSLVEQQFPYVYLDATYCKARVNRRVVSPGRGDRHRRAGRRVREVLGFAVRDSEDGAFWTGFLRSLKARGLRGPQLVISDAHTGLKQAIGDLQCIQHFEQGRLVQGHRARTRPTLLTCWPPAKAVIYGSRGLSSPAAARPEVEGACHLLSGTIEWAAVTPHVTRNSGNLCASWCPQSATR
jgi:hypothetical protein